jgi:glutathione S-transferase
MQLLEMGYEHANWSVGRDYERIRQYNPMVKVPTLVLDDGEVLSESSAILDYLDQSAGPARALLPAYGRARRDALKLMALSMLVAGIHLPPEREDSRTLARAAAISDERWTGRAGSLLPGPRFATVADRQRDESGRYHRELWFHLSERRATGCDDRRALHAPGAVGCQV